MPRLASVEIPLYSTSPSSGKVSVGRSNTPAEARVQGRQYDDEPLPVKPSSDKLGDARIVGRVIDGRGAFYQLKIGDVEINDVGVDEILDYVSAQDLEEYETRAFEEESELIRIAEIESEQRKREKQERRKERARTKGIVLMRSGEFDGDEAAGTDDDAAEVATGKHGRARPDYSQFYLKPEKKLPPAEQSQSRRRRRKRDPRTGELMPLSDDDMESSEEDGVQPAIIQGQSGLDTTTKRRRRRRDPVTGELMPLDAVDISYNTSVGNKKRRRRRRHPRTGELMPHGWKYGPNAPEEKVRNDNTSHRGAGGVGAMSPALHRLSISHEHESKRMKLDSRSASGQSPSARVQIPSSSRETTGTESESESEHDRGPAYALSNAKSPPKSMFSPTRGRLGMTSALQPASATALALESSPEPMNSMTSILQPVTGPSDFDTPEDEDDDLTEGEWIIEGILTHRMSDPRTHAPELGRKSVMLYQVKWEGWDEPTWEPIESFSDRSVVEHYQRRVAAENAVKMAKKAGTEQSSSKPIPGSSSNRLSAAPQAPRQQSEATSARVAHPRIAKAGDATDDESEENDEESDAEGVYVVEDILDHHLSDPRTHPSEHGTEPVTLYKVKWKGYQGFTWEPIDSFDDWTDVNRYRAKVGLHVLRQEDHDDEDDEEESMN